MIISGKKYILILGMIFLIGLPVSVMARSGCCSWHNGVSGECSNGYQVCNDGTEVIVVFVNLMIH